MSEPFTGRESYFAYVVSPAAATASATNHVKVVNEGTLVRAHGCGRPPSER